MVIETDEGIRIKVTEAPHWSDYHLRWYVCGYRWIKTRRDWSRQLTLHNFTACEVVQ